MPNNGILIQCEAVNGNLASITIELLGAGQLLAQALAQPLNAVLIGHNVNSLAQEAIAYGAEKVFVVDHPYLKNYLTEPYLMVMEKAVKQISPSIVLMGQTSSGRELTPRLAFRLNTAATLDCISLAIDSISKRLLMTKPVYGGNAHTIQICETDPQIASVRSKVLTPAVRDSSRQGEIINLSCDIDFSLMKTKLVERNSEARTGVKLEDAHVIVTGGRGIGGPEGFKQLEELANVLKGAVGASRPACDNEWISDNQQVGLTGKIVSPDLYIAVGVSGSSQHMSGCSSAKVIVAINKDPEANIFKVAHYGIVADWKKALPALTNKVKELVA
jgi:electron transfer flavoprotein alpha subunit